MDNPAYVALSRQAGLDRALQAVANNIANLSTAGFRRESVIFAEMLAGVPEAPGTLAMTAARVRRTDTGQGGLRLTGGTLDLALEGPGFFRVATPAGERLTRAGAFALSPEGDLVTLDGHPVLDAGGAPVFVPPGAAKISIAADGTLDADGTPTGQIGIVEVADPASLVREGGLLFVPAEEPLPAAATRLVQGALEEANVEPVVEMTRMIEIQRAYELGQGFLDREDDRIRAVIRSLGQAA
jgi:flagellar basal-body rod protein FlgF